jgi:iron complex transport system substrate-binding protein
MRIVSLLPSATEILFGIGAGAQVVGVTHECDYPPDALLLPKLTSASGPQFERSADIDRHVRAAIHSGSSLYDLDSKLLERLSPDLIVTQELCAVCAVSYDTVTAAVRRLRSDARVVSLEPTSLRDVFATIEFLGEISGRARKARALVATLAKRIDALRDNTASVRTLFLEWTDPPMSAGHWIPELIEIAGGIPVLADHGANSRRLDWEAIAASDPDAIVVAPCGFDLAKTQNALAELGSTQRWRALRAVRNGNVLALDGNAYMSRPGPRLVDATEILARWYTKRAEYAG